MTTVELLNLIHEAKNSLEIAEIYLEDGAFNSASAHLNDLEEHAAYLRRGLDAAIERENEAKRAWFCQTTGIQDRDQSS